MELNEKEKASLWTKLAQALGFLPESNLANDANEDDSILSDNATINTNINEEDLIS